MQFSVIILKLETVCINIWNIFHLFRLEIVYVNHSSIIFVFARKFPTEFYEIKAENFVLLFRRFYFGFHFSRSQAGLQL